MLLKLKRWSVSCNSSQRRVPLSPRTECARIVRVPRARARRHAGRDVPIYRRRDALKRRWLHWCWHARRCPRSGSGSTLLVFVPQIAVGTAYWRFALEVVSALLEFTLELPSALELVFADTCDGCCRSRRRRYRWDAGPRPLWYWRATVFVLLALTPLVAFSESFLLFVL